MSWATSLFDTYGPTLRTGQVAELLGCSPSHVRALCQRGELPAIRIGKRWVVPTIKIADLLSGGNDYEQ